MSVKLKHSLLVRAFAKAQTIVVQKLMKMTLGHSYRNEDVHLQHYSVLQTEAESRIEGSRGSSSLPSKTRLLLVIPFRDKWGLTALCLRQICVQDISGLEIMVALVDNGSEEQQTLDGIATYKLELESRGFKVRSLRYETPFNFSFLNNQAVRDCADFQADVVGLLNNDIEFIDEKSIKELVLGTTLPDAGAVGCTLLYPNRKIQHLFVFVGSKIVGSHPYKGKDLDLKAAWYQRPRAVGAVTGAVMFIQRQVFEKVGGFDEMLPTSYQDVDLCLKFQKMGLVNWVLPNVHIIHHETQTRSVEPSWNEAEYVEKKWGSFLLTNPFVSPVWSRRSEHFVFTLKAYLRHLFGKLPN